MQAKSWFSGSIQLDGAHSNQFLRHTTLLSVYMRERRLEWLSNSRPYASNSQLRLKLSPLKHASSNMSQIIWRPTTYTSTNIKYVPPICNLYWSIFNPAVSSGRHSDMQILWISFMHWHTWSSMLHRLTVQILKYEGATGSWPSLHPTSTRCLVTRECEHIALRVNSSPTGTYENWEWLGSRTTTLVRLVPLVRSIGSDNNIIILSIIL